MIDDPLVSKIVSRIADAIQPRRIILFGSRAQGAARQNSDVDLVIIYDGPIPKRELKQRVHELFEHPDFSMDLFVLSTDELQRKKHVANSLAREITERGVLVYGS